MTCSTTPRDKIYYGAEVDKNSKYCSQSRTKNCSKPVESRVSEVVRKSKNYS